MFGRVNRRQTQQGSAEAKALCLQLEQHIEMASRKRLASVVQNMVALRPGWQAAIEQDLAFVRHASMVREAMREVRTGSPVVSHRRAPLRFQVSSLFLLACWRYLTSDANGRERLHLVSGPITPEGVRILSHIEKITLGEQSSAYVKGDPNATHKRVVELVERDGHELLSVFHSHIMRGADSTKPSPTDFANQDRFVQIGWQAIGGIFSLDGYVRFFSTGNDFQLALYGNAAQVVSTAPREVIAKLSVPS